MTNWRVLPHVYCTNCGQGLEARPKTFIKNIIKGCEPMEYRHINGEYDCPPVIKKAHPYDSWGKFELWKKEGQK